MPNYKTHLVGGAASFVGLLWATSHLLPALACQPVLLPAAFGLTLLGSIFPDIDVPSKMQRLFFLCSTVGIITCLLARWHIGFLLLSLGILVVAFLTHRTITHKPLFLAALGLVPTLLFTNCHPTEARNAISLYLYFFTGCLSHILLDRTLTWIKKVLGRGRRY